MTAAPGSGPCGWITKGEPAPTATARFYVIVDSIDGTLARAGELGATTVLPRTEIGCGHGFFAHFRAPDGNVIGIYNRDGK